jgi:hypothetical protein
MDGPEGLVPAVLLVTSRAVYIALPQAEPQRIVFDDVECAGCWHVFEDSTDLEIWWRRGEGRLTGLSVELPTGDLEFSVVLERALALARPDLPRVGRRVFTGLGVHPMLAPGGGSS